MSYLFAISVIIFVSLVSSCKKTSTPLSTFNQIVSTSNSSDETQEPVKYNPLDDIIAVGTSKIQRDSEGKITHIGTESVQYNSDGLITHVGNRKVQYDSMGKMTHIGNDIIQYDIEGKILQIGENRVYY